VLVLVWGWVERRVRDPLVDLRMLAHRPILFTNLIALIAGFAMFGTFVLIPNFVETPHGLPHATAQLVHYGFDATATRAGVYLLPGSFMLLFAGPIAGWLGSRIGFKWPLAAGMLVVAASAGLIAAFHSRPWQIWVNQGLLGIGIGFAFASMATLIAENVRLEETGVATGMNTVMRSVGGGSARRLGPRFSLPTRSRAPRSRPRTASSSRSRLAQGRPSPPRLSPASCPSLGRYAAALGRADVA
jgi:MFS family permease